MTTTPEKAPRLLTMDIMRGLTLFLMLFVNDLHMSGVPPWLGHREASYDGMGLADWVFPGFLFMVGMAIPFAITSRRKKGESNSTIAGHIVMRTASLLFIGVLMLNAGRVNPELSGINRNWWAVGMYIAVFLIWNMYPKSGPRLLEFTLKGIGIALLAWLLFIFRAGTPGNESWIETGWWGILGLIGWGYLVAALAHLFFGRRMWACALLWVAFIGLNTATQSGWLTILDPVMPLLGVVLGGNIPSIVMAGLLTAMLLQRYTGHPWKQLTGIAILGVISLCFGFILREWFILSKIHGTPSWAMVCNGISMIVFVLLFAAVDVFGHNRSAGLFSIAGKNSLTTYLAPDIIYYLCWGFGIPLFFYKQDHNAWLAIDGSLVWAAAMIGFTHLLTRIHIRLKL